ncbi:MAG: endonuclease III domain-containing protein [Thermoguttaceae bacterium]|nr:endonuclease III domain-containing protein [Thermoguttaceae bacterium]
MFATLYQTLLKHYPMGPWWPGSSALEVAVGTILTQNTTWKSVERSIQNLKDAGILELNALLEIPEEELAQLIRPSGFAVLKSRRLRNLLEMICTRYGSSMEKMAERPRDELRKELLDVNGVGRETADSILLYALGIPSFVVDAYTRRILSRHEILPEKMPYDEIRHAFEEALPHETAVYAHFHAMIVEVCKEFCLKTSPRCENCPLRDFPAKPAKFP